MAGGALEAQWDAELRAQGLILAVEGWPGGFEASRRTLAVASIGAAAAVLSALILVLLVAHVVTL